MIKQIKPHQQMNVFRVIIALVVLAVPLTKSARKVLDYQLIFPGSFSFYDHDSKLTNKHFHISGSYCPSGSSSPTDCPPGTYGDGPMLSSRSQCSPCDPGYYCDVGGLTSPKGGCLEGWLVNR